VVASAVTVKLQLLTLLLKTHGLGVLVIEAYKPVLSVMLIVWLATLEPPLSVAVTVAVALGARFNVVELNSIVAEEPELTGLLAEPLLHATKAPAQISGASQFKYFLIVMKSP
jgi:hypothetical protein